MTLSQLKIALALAACRTLTCENPFGAQPANVGSRASEASACWHVWEKAARCLRWTWMRGRRGGCSGSIPSHGTWLRCFRWESCLGKCWCLKHFLFLNCSQGRTEEGCLCKAAGGQRVLPTGSVMLRKGWWKSLPEDSLLSRVCPQS